MSNILVTGASGFLGSHLCDLLLEQENFVFGIDNFLTSNGKNIEHLKLNSHFKFLRSDISLGLPSNFNIPFDEIFHLASPASPPIFMEHPLETARANSRGTELLLEHVKKFGGKILFASTSEIYGDPLVHPQTENYWGNVNPIGPRSVYDESKRFGETLVSLYQRQNWADTSIVRIFNTYGPRLNPNDGRVISSFLRDALLGKPLQVFGDGTQTRSFCYVDDLIEGIFKAMNSKISDPINLGNPNEFTLLELAEVVGHVTGIKPVLNFKSLPADDPKRRKPDITRAKELLNWVPKIQLEDGLATTAEWMKKFLYS